MQENTNENAEQPAVSTNAKQVIDIATPGLAKAIAARIKEDIDNYCIKTYDSGFHRRLGAAAVGEECSRRTWYAFRWCLKEKQSGRMLRLFNRGQREEARFVEWLRGIGCTVWQYADEATKKQYRLSAVHDHFAGFLDAIVKLPPSYKIDEPLIAEFKTMGTGRHFTELCTSGVILGKSIHFTQMSIYGKEYKLRYGAYFNICKNDDELHVEIVKLDHNLGEQMLVKAERIITSQTAPPRISDQPTYHVCTYCPMREICHFKKVPEKNCRSCVNAVPAEDAQWLCNFYGNLIPKDFIPQGCGSWKSITE